MHRAAPVADSQTHTEEAQYIVVKGSAYEAHRRSLVPVVKCAVNKPHRGEPYLSSRSTLSYIRAVSCHHDYLSGRKPHTLPRHIPNNALTDNTKLHNIYTQRQISADQHRATAYHKHVCFLVFCGLACFVVFSYPVR